MNLVDQATLAARLALSNPPIYIDGDHKAETDRQMVCLRFDQRTHRQGLNRREFSPARTRPVPPQRRHSTG